MLEAVFFDLDGTFADTAPDLAAAANSLRADRGLEPLPLERLRPMASHGARGMLGEALGLTPQDEAYAATAEVFLQRYEAALCVHTVVFDGLWPVVDALEARGLAWGIVTNKAMRFAGPLCRALGIEGRAAAVVGGDTTPHAKPHPAPLLHAASVARVEPGGCIYVGDDLRDVQAGRAAGMRTVAVAYGYNGKGDPPDAWGADHLVMTPAELGGALAL
ncbi:MAG: phosphoglycolate phosphatase [Rhodocyclaceae bacterium]|nr:phosphoglycolate phosphatase [Rhodocyclaceae bacterium]